MERNRLKLWLVYHVFALYFKYWKFVQVSCENSIETDIDLYLTRYNIRKKEKEKVRSSYEYINLDMNNLRKRIDFNT